MLICASLCFVERLNFVDQIQFLFAIHDADGTLKLCLKFLKSAFTDNIDFFIVIVMSLASSFWENPLTLFLFLNVFLQCISVDKNKLISLCIISSLKKLTVAWSKRLLAHYCTSSSSFCVDYPTTLASSHQESEFVSTRCKVKKHVRIFAFKRAVFLPFDDFEARSVLAWTWLGLLRDTSAIKNAVSFASCNGFKRCCVVLSIQHEPFMVT